MSLLVDGFYLLIEFLNRLDAFFVLDSLIFKEFFVKPLVCYLRFKPSKN